MIKTLSDKIVAYTLSAIFTLTIGICTLFAVLTVDNSTHAGADGGVNPNNIQISAGGFGHTLAIIDGKLYAWGDNQGGQIGDGTIGFENSKYLPVRIGNQDNWVTVSAGDFHSLAINELGELWSWGRNSSGAFGDGTTEDKYVPTKIGTATNWKSVAAGRSHSIAINTDGELYAWGYNGQGQLGDGTMERKHVPTKIGTDANWVFVSTGWHCSFAINELGELWAWGYNYSGHLGDGTKTDRHSPVKIGNQKWKSVSNKDSHTLAITIDGELYAWGSNMNHTADQRRLPGGALGLGDTMEQLTPARVGSASNWVDASAGTYHSLAINSDGELFSWGYNGLGELGLGLGDHDARNVPTLVGDQTNWVGISAGRQFSVAVNNLSELFSWGGGGMGSLGLGDNANRNVPTEVFLHNVAAPTSELGYTISDPSVTRASIGGSYTFTITMQPTYTAPIVKLNTPNGKLNFSSIDKNEYTYTITNVTGDITASNFTISVSKI